MAVVIGEAAIAVRADASKTADDIQDKVGPAAEKAGEDAGDRISAGMLAGFAAAGTAVAAGFTASLESAALGDKLAAQLGGSPEYAAEMGDIAGNLYADAYGDSLGSVNDALRSVLQSGLLPEDATNEQIESITANALDLATAFDQDVAGAAQAAGRMVQTGLAENAEQAMDILTRGFQQGADRGGDLLDVLNEYGTTFSEVGLTGGQAVGLLNQALAAGIPNADFAADALREMGIIGREAGEGAAEALDSLGLSSADYFAAMQEGGPAASAALDTVLDRLRSTEDPALRAKAAAELVGTQYEDLGDAILQMDPSAAVAGLGQIEGATTTLGDTLNDNASTRLTGFMRSAEEAFVNVIGGQVIPVIESATAWLSDNLGPALDTVGGFITDNVVPPLEDLATWLGENEAVLQTVAAVITGIIVPALGVWGVRSIIAAAQNTIAWFTTAAAASTSAGRQSASALQVVVGWTMMAARALISAAQVVGGWVLMGTQSLLQAGRMAAAWFIALGPIGWVIAAVIGLVALVVANWETVKNATAAAWEWVTTKLSEVWEGIKAFISAGLQFLTDLFLNFTGPGLIIQHWDTIKQATTDAWNAVVEFVTGIPGRLWDALSTLGTTLWNLATSAWDLFDSAVDTAVNAVVEYVAGMPGRFVANLSALGSLIAGVATSAWQWFSDAVSRGVTNVINFVTGIPGRIMSALGNLGSLLVGAGGDLIRGLVNGISSAASFVGDVAGSIWRAIRGFINSNLIDKLNNLLEFTIAGVTINPPDIPRLHEGGVFTASSGEGLALLRDGERVITPEQRVIADRLLAGLLGGTVPGGGGGAPTITINENVYAAPGEPADAVAARTTQSVVWNLNGGLTRRLGAEVLA